MLSQNIPAPSQNGGVTSIPRRRLTKVSGVSHALSPTKFADFEIDGEKYNSMAQYIAMKKALCFNDYESYTEIKETQNPCQCNTVPINGYSEEIWLKEAPNYLLKGAKACFSNSLNKGKRKYLVLTSPNKILFLSDYEKVLGCKIIESDDENSDPKLIRYVGHNLWGQTLVSIRAYIMSATEFEEEISEIFKKPKRGG